MAATTVVMNVTHNNFKMERALPLHAVRVQTLTALKKRPITENRKNQ